MQREGLGAGGGRRGNISIVGERFTGKVRRTAHREPGSAPGDARAGE